MQTGQGGEANVPLFTLGSYLFIQQAYIFEDQKGDSTNNDKTVNQKSLLLLTRFLDL